MKKTKNPKPSLPKGRVHYTIRFCRGMSNGTHSYRNFFSAEPKEEVFPVAVLPFPSRKKAQAFVRFWNTGEEKRVEWVAAQLFHPLTDYCRAKNPEAVRHEQARAVLALMEGKQ